MRTIVYVDGYNLFYSVLTKSPYKWLDLYTLFDRHLVRSVEPASEINSIKYFTAPALGSMSKDPKVEQRQARYHRALNTNNSIDIIKGYHQKAITTGFPVESIEGVEKLKVHVMEEKQTDVNIGLHMYRDVVRQECDQIVLCSNDADLEPVLQMIREDFPDIKIGLILPRHSGNQHSRLAKKLMNHSHWTRKSIREEELAASQLSINILDHKNRTIKCPDEWK